MRNPYSVNITIGLFLNMVPCTQFRFIWKMNYHQFHSRKKETNKRNFSVDGRKPFDDKES